MTERGASSRRTLFLCLAAVSLAVAALSSAIVIYLVILLGDRGLEADANGTAGYTSPVEAIGLIGGAISVPLFLAIAITFLVIAKRRPTSFIPVAEG